MKVKIAAAAAAFTMALCSIQSVCAAGVFGDVNGDGKFSVRDVSSIAQSISKGKTSSLSSEADFNRDGNKDVRDAAFMAAFISQKPTFEEMLKQVNRLRSSYGAAPLTLDDRLCAAASLRAREIISKLSHTRPDNSDCFTVLEQYNMPQYSFAGENIAAGSHDVSGTMDQWINSEGHFKNMISTNFTKLGVGVVHVPNTFYGSYWVQEFFS